MVVLNWAWRIALLNAGLGQDPVEPDLIRQYVPSTSSKVVGLGTCNPAFVPPVECAVLVAVMEMVA